MEYEYLNSIVLGFFSGTNILKAEICFDSDSTIFNLYCVRINLFPIKRKKKKLSFLLYIYK